MRMIEIVQSRLFLGTIVGLTVGAAVQGVALTVLARRNAAAALPVAVPVGAPVDLLVHEAGERSSQNLRDIGTGSCRLIIVYSPTCGASLAAGRRWHQDIMASPDTVALPDGWTVAWLSIADSVATAGFLPEGFPLRRVYANTANEVASRLGIREFPAHLILDANGRILSGGVGAPLYQPGAYGADCRVATPRGDSNAP